LGLSPLGDREAKTDRALSAFARARHAEVEGGGAHAPRMLGVVVTPEALKFVGGGTVLAGKGNIRRVLLLYGGTDTEPVKGKLEMFVSDARGTLVRGETVTLGEICWIPLLPPELPGLYPIRFFATLEAGARLEARGLLTVIADKEMQ
jgi:hypothetical protein